ncbi:protein Barley B recombinant-like [Curcuma longa]|uniref:protein Barley B recombinant-like n=1 Tax=Curcuma longa TaxID=136217 RepID=UPI003D9F6234
MEEDGGLGISNWGYYEASSKGNLGLRLMPSMVERDVKPLLTTGGFLHRHRAAPEPPVQLNSMREGWSYHSCDNGKSSILRDGWFHDANDNSRSFHILPVSHEDHPAGFGFLTDPPTHSLQVLQLEEPRPKDDKTPTTPKKRTRSRQRKSPKTKRPKKVSATSNEVPGGSLSHRKVPRKGSGMVINGIDFDISRIPTPVCSCTGKPQPCYRWGVGGWQSACCTTSISTYPLPMNAKRRGARIAGRKMSRGAFKKVLEKLAGEGYNLANPIDMRSFWAKHGTNKYVTIR